MNIYEDIVKLFNVFCKHWVLIIPSVINIVLMILLVSSYFYVTGITQTIELYKQHSLDYNSYLEDIKNDPYSTDHYSFNEFLHLKSFDKEISNFVNIKTVIYTIAYGLLLFFTTVYLASILYSMIALLIKNHKLKLKIIVHNANKYFYTLLELRIILFFILFFPVIIGLIFLFSMSYINLFITSLTLIFISFLIIFYVLSVLLRLIFSTPIMFIEHKPAVKSIKHSFHITRNHIIQMCIIVFIILCLSFISKQLTTPLGLSFFKLFNSNSIVAFGLNFIVSILFLLVESIVYTIEHLFLFFSYVDIKKDMGL